MDRTFIVERLDGTKPAVRAAQLVPNPAVSYLQEHPNARGKECSCSAAHDAKQCQYIHFQTIVSARRSPERQNRYTVQLRDGSKRLCESAQLHPGPALQYLDTHPNAVGKECIKTEIHDVGSCAFIHFTQAFAHALQV
jgi:hypothetical protein